MFKKSYFLVRLYRILIILGTKTWLLIRVETTDFNTYSKAVVVSLMEMRVANTNRKGSYALCNAPHCQDTISKKISYVLLSIVMGRRRDLSDPRMDFFWRSIPQRLMWAFGVIKS